MNPLETMQQEEFQLWNAARRPKLTHRKHQFD